MSAQYEKALQAWGAKKLQESYHYATRVKTNGPLMVDKKTVKVKMDFQEGYVCGCDGDPQCYCSLAESPSANIKITGMASFNNHGAFNAETEISHYEFDFVQILGEIVEAGDGVLTREDR
jgi:hypothetical protein